MKLVVFGLSISSSWGNGHATLWRGLCRALGDAGHRTVFFERDVPYYAANRDLDRSEADAIGVSLRLYGDWDDVRASAARELADADAALVTSFCPDGVAASELVLASRASVRAFYDLDTPVTLERLARGAAVPYLPPRGLRDFDLVLSYTGGRALTALVDQLGARRVAPLYGSVDPAVHRPAPPRDELRADLSYLATYAADRQPAVLALFIEPARRAPERRFLLAGSMYPADFPWTTNLFYLPHVAPPDHAAFYSSSRFTLSTTRKAMAEMGHCPSGRLFEAAACGVPVISDAWQGIDRFFTPGDEILIASRPDDVLAALALGDAERDAIARRARDRALAEHTAEARAATLLDELEAAAAARPDDGFPPERAPTVPRSSVSEV
jgi:spore maturation protein CgeB